MIFYQLPNVWLKIRSASSLQISSQSWSCTSVSISLLSKSRYDENDWSFSFSGSMLSIYFTLTVIVRRVFEA